MVTLFSLELMSKFRKYIGRPSTGEYVVTSDVHCIDLQPNTMDNLIFFTWKLSLGLSPSPRENSGSRLKLESQFVSATNASN